VVGDGGNEEGPESYALRDAVRVFAMLVGEVSYAMSCARACKLVVKGSLLGRGGGARSPETGLVRVGGAAAKQRDC
jgi:hypothetical protein